MPPFLQFVIRRFLVIPVSLFIITIVLYGGVMLTPPEARATLYYPPRMNPNMTEEQMLRFQETIIERYHLRDSFLIQYGYWVRSLFDGTWGYSPSMNEDVLPALLRRTPITLELGLYSLLFLVPLGLVSGVIAGWKRSGAFDRFFRASAFLGTSTPSFILALALLSVFYINLGWFAPGRYSLNAGLELSKDTFNHVTGMLTIDTLLNGRPDLFIDAWKHLAMPIFTLSLYHWATLGRIARASMINERSKEYVLSARDVGGVVLLQATLTFVQIGGDSIWGQMLSQGRNWVIGPGGSLFRYWWVWLPPTLAVMLFGIAWNMFGDGLNDALEPPSQRGFGRKPFWSRFRRKEPETRAKPGQERSVAVPLVVPGPTPREVQVLPPETSNQVSSTNGMDHVLLTARDGLSCGDLPRALHAYNHLIRRGRLIEEVLPDLARLIKNHPRDPQVWQTLGDALAKAGRTEHADQSYEQARKLRK